MTGFLGSLIPAIAPTIMGALTGNTGRMSHERFMEAEQRTDWDNERNIARENTFLSGVTQNRADNYNTYQDTTSPEDTRRNTERIQSMSQDLGMSPWELTGSGSTGQGAVSPGGTDTNNATGNSGQFLASQTQLEAQKMASRTQLATTAMQTDAQLKSSGVNVQKNSIQEKQRMQIAAQTALTELQGAQTEAGTRLTNNSIFLSQLQMVLDALPESTLHIAGQSMRGKTGTLPVLRALKEATSGWQGRDDALESAIDKFPDNKVGQLEKELSSIAQAGGRLAKETLKQGSNAFKKGSEYLGSLFK